MAMAAKKLPRGKPFQKGADPRRKVGLDAGRVSLTYTARRFLAMSPSELADEVDAVKTHLSKLGKGSSTMAEIIMASFLYQLANDPQPGNMRELWRRIDGEVPQTVFDVDPATLTDEQLDRLRNGESIEAVMDDARRARVGISATQQSETETEDVARNRAPKSA